MRRWRLMIIGLICVGLALILILNFQSVLEWGKRDFLPSSPVPAMTDKANVDEDVLTAWIISHSNRISARTAREIAREAIRTEMPLMILAIIMAESEFVPTAVSNKGAIGLTQIRYEIHGKELIRLGLIKEKRDLFDIGSSIRSGHFIFEMYLKQSQGNVEKAMEFYLGGKDGTYMRKISVTLANLYVLSVKKRKEE